LPKAGLFLYKGAGGGASYLLVGAKEHSNAARRREAQVSNGLNSVNSDGYARLHVQNTRSQPSPSFHPEGPLLGGARGPDSIHVAQYQGSAITFAPGGQQIVSSLTLAHSLYAGPKMRQTVLDVSTHRIHTNLIVAEGFKIYQVGEGFYYLICVAFRVLLQAAHYLPPK